MNTDKYFEIFKIKHILELDQDELKRRFRILVQKYHPDHGGTNAQFCLIQDAHEYLKMLLEQTLRKEEEKFFNPNLLFYSDGSVYDKRKKRWVKFKGVFINN